MAFSLANAMSGAGGAVADVGAEWGKSIIREGAESRLMEQRGKQETALMQERARIEELRIQRERDRVAKIGAEAEAARTGPAYDPATDSTRPQTPAEAANAAASVYNRNGMIAEAMRTREFEETRAARAEDRLDRRIDRTADNERADRQLAMTERHQKAMEGLQAASNRRMADLAKVQLEAAQFDLDNKKELKTMQDKFAASTDPAERATLERNILTRLGKAKELPEPVKLYVDTVKAELTAIAKAEADGMPLSPASQARRTELQGQMAQLVRTGSIDLKGGGAAVPPDAHIVALQKDANDPRAVAAFEAAYGKGSAKRYLGESTPSTPSAQPAQPRQVQPAKPTIPDDLKQDYEVATRLSQALMQTRTDMANAKGDAQKLLDLNKQYSQQQSVLDQYKQRFSERGIRL